MLDISSYTRLYLDGRKTTLGKNLLYFYYSFSICVLSPEPDSCRWVESSLHVDFRRVRLDIFWANSCAAIIGGPWKWLTGLSEQGCQRYCLLARLGLQYHPAPRAAHESHQAACRVLYSGAATTCSVALKQSHAAPGLSGPCLTALWWGLMSGVA